MSNRSQIVQINRRAVLRGAGAVMALPWLESFAPAATPDSTAFPKRFAVLFMGNGVNENHWGAEGNGTAMKLQKSLEPLEPIKHKINVINGLFNKEATGHGVHPSQTGSLLSGVEVAKGAVIHSGVSIDQVIAKTYGQETMQPSIVLACEQPMTGYHETNYSMAYSSHISWESPDSPVPNEIYPALAFDNLFENRGSERNLSILDRLNSAVQSLTKRVSATDARKIDEYLTSVREVEARVDIMRKHQDKAEDAAKLKNRPAWTMDRPANGLPEDLRDHARLMCDLIAMAFQTDKTRVASLLLARDLGSLFYPFLQVEEHHHTASHNNLSDGYERITRFHLGQMAYLATKLDSMPEGDGTVLDNSCLMFISNLWVGRTHDNFRLPVVLAGGLGGTLKTGRSLDYLEAGDENRKLCSLYLGILDRMDIKLEHFGDANSRLVDL